MWSASERGDEALDLVLHVRLRQALEVADERLGAAVELLVEALDGVLVEDAELVPLAVGAAQEHLPVRRGGLLPLDRVDEVAVALGADVQVARSARRRRQRLGAAAVGVVLEVDDLDGAARGQDHAADVLAVVSEWLMLVWKWLLRP